MLAEPKRRVRWSNDPRNTSWTNDHSKFGQRLLEKQGWKLGDGLGKDRQGITECIRPHIKLDEKAGVGASSSEINVVAAHKDDYEAILKSFNSSPKDVAFKPKVDMVDAMSKSKTRASYKRFAKSKNLSTATNADLNAIFAGVNNESYVQGSSVENTELSTVLTNCEEDSSRKRKNKKVSKRKIDKKLKLSASLTACTSDVT